jgi:hypothetical protein
MSTIGGMKYILLTNSGKWRKPSQCAKIRRRKLKVICGVTWSKTKILNHNATVLQLVPLKNFYLNGDV